MDSESNDSICLFSDEEDIENQQNKYTQESDYRQALKNLWAHFVRFNLSLTCLENTAKIMNQMPGASVKLPTTKYKLMKEFSNSGEYVIEYHIYCDRCKVYSKCFEQWECSRCSKKIKLSETNYFTYIPLEQQLKNILHKHWDDIMKFRNEMGLIEDGVITDAHCCEVTKNALKEDKNTLCIMINSDGVSMKKSSLKSLWPLQIIANFLPPHLRFRLGNVLSVGFHYDDTKPNMLEFCKPLAEELQNLSEGFVFKGQVFRVAVTHAAFDLPAKAMFQQTMQYNGYDGCGYCNEHGEKTDAGVRFVNRHENIRMRTHEDFVRFMAKVMTTQNAEIIENGIIGISPGICFDHFDMVKSFCIDYMHNVLIGVTKSTMEFWLSPKKHHESLLSKKSRAWLNERIESIKPCRFITRLPRSLALRRTFKASEYRSLLLYYLPVCLQGVLAKKYLDHFKLLSACIFKLLGTHISDQDLTTAENCLQIFVRQYEEYYGQENMTMNVHLLIHIVSCVRNLGPLWAQSMFAFESNNAVFSRYVNGNQDIMAQVNLKYAMKEIVKTEKEHTKTNVHFSVNKTIRLTECEKIAIASRKILLKNISAVPIHCVYENSIDRYTSIQYTKAKRTIDYFVELENAIGKVKYYFHYQNQNFAVIEEFEMVTNINHIIEVVPKNIVQVYLVEDIKKKFIYISFCGKHFITVRPNPFEGD